MSKLIQSIQVIMLPTIVEAPNFTKGHIVKCIKDWQPFGENKRTIGHLTISKNICDGVLKNYEAQHLYFTSFDKIEVGDWIYNNKTGISKVIEIVQGDYLSDKGICERISCKKIIASTDLSLNIPTPNNDFINLFCDKGGIGEIKIRYSVDKLKKKIWPRVYSPKINENNNIEILPVKENYTRNQVIELLKQSHFHGWFCRERLETQDKYPYNLPNGLDYEEKEKFCFDRWIKDNLPF